jgi:hypothetical protein
MPYLIQPAQAQLSQLPVTGQITSYETGDDGYYQSGFDPATRFEEAVLAGVTVVIDHATSLMWPWVYSKKLVWCDCRLRGDPVCRVHRLAIAEY